MHSYDASAVAIRCANSEYHVNFMCALNKCVPRLIEPHTKWAFIIIIDAMKNTKHNFDRVYFFFSFFEFENVYYFGASNNVIMATN